MTALEPHASTEVSRSAAPAPVAAAWSGFVGAFLALLLIGVGALGVRDAAVAIGLLHGDLLIPRGFGAITEIAPQPWMLAAGVAVGLVGFALAVIAVLPRRSAAVRVDAETAVYVRPRDVAVIATAAALDVPGVLAANTSATTRGVTVRCRVTGDENDARALVVDAVDGALEPLHRRPRISVRIRQEALS